MKLTLEYVLSHGRGNERMFICPVHQDHKPSASVNLAKGVWYCYTCHAKGKVVGGPIEVPLDELLDELDELLGAETRVYPETWLSVFDSGPVHPYWLGRFTPEAARHFRLGYDFSRNAGTYPLRNAAGEVLGVVRRNLDDIGPKYRYPSGVTITDHLFNYSPAHRNEITLVEGALDVVAAWEAGVEAMAIYGSQLSKAQIALIDKIAPDQINLCFDQDKAGRECAQTAYGMLRHYEPVTVTWSDRLGKDLGELTIDERRNILQPLAL